MRPWYPWGFSSLTTYRYRKSRISKSRISIAMVFSVCGESENGSFMGTKAPFVLLKVQEKRKLNQLELKGGKVYRKCTIQTVWLKMPELGTKLSKGFSNTQCITVIGCQMMKLAKELDGKEQAKQQKSPWLEFSYMVSRRPSPCICGWTSGFSSLRVILHNSAECPIYTSSHQDSNN